MAYTNSQLVTYTKISPNTYGKRTHAIDTITIHCYVGHVNVKNGTDTFSKPGYKYSCNYLMADDGQIGLVLQEEYASICSSSKSNDNRAITIETSSDSTGEIKITDAALNGLITLCTDICQRNGIKQLVWSTNKNDRVNHLNGCNLTVHRDYAAKSCPGDYIYGKMQYIADEVNKRLGTNTNVPELIKTTTRNYLMKGDKGNDVIKLQENLNCIGYSCGNVDGIFGSNTDSALRKFQAAYGLVVDGKYGIASKTKLESLVKGNAESLSNSNHSSIYSHEDFVKDVQSAIGAKVDGIAGNETLSKTITVSKTKNSRHAVVKPIQKYLNSIGFDCGIEDGIAGSKFDSAVKLFQKANGCVVDGEITSKANTWKKLLKLA